MYILIMLVAAAVLVDFILRKVLDIPRSKFWAKYEYESLALERWDKYVMVAFVLFSLIGYDFYVCRTLYRVLVVFRHAYFAEKYR